MTDVARADDNEGGPTATTPNATPCRWILDDEGRRWSVCERCASPSAEASISEDLGWRVRGWLVFRGAHGTVCRLPLPPMWHTLPDDALRALLTAARTADG